MPALLFDIGNVLVTFDFSRAAKRLAEHCAISQAEILARIEPLKIALESGAMPDAEFVFRAMDVIDYEGSDADFRETWCDIFALNAPMAATLAALPTQVPAYLFSNTSGLHLDWLLAKYSVFKHFQGGIYSHEAKSAKPARGMFDQAIARFGLDPASTLYVDDLADNIATGQRLGFVTHQYDLRQHERFHRELLSFL